MPRKVDQWMYYISTSIKFLGSRLLKFNVTPHESGSSMVSHIFDSSAIRTDKVDASSQISSLSHRRTKRVWSGILAPLLVLSLFVAPSATLAQQTSSDLVSNLTQTTVTSGGGLATGSDRSTTFTTGGNTMGYVLTAVKWKISVSTGLELPVYTLDIYSDSSGKPGSKLHELTKPDSLPTGTSEVTYNSSEADGFSLDPNTTYHLVFDGDHVVASNVAIEFTNSSDEDTGSATGWSIGNTIPYRNSATGDWEDDTGVEAMQFAIVGYTVTTPPTASITPGGTINMVTGQSLELTGSGEDPDGDAVTYSWSLSAANSGTDTTNVLISDPADATIASFSTTVADTYTVTLTATDANMATGTDTVTIVVRENTNPTASIDVPSGPIDVLSGANLELTGSATDPDLGDSIQGYLWSVTPATATVTTAGSDNSSMATFTSTTVGTYTVTLEVIDQGGISGTDTLTVTVKATLPPTVTIAPTGDQYADLDTDLVLTATAAEPGEPSATLTYSWSVSNSSGVDVTSDVLSGASTATATFNSSNEGDYTVTLVVSDNDTPTPETTTVTLTVTIAQQRLVLSSSAVTVAESGGTDSWTVELSTQPTDAVTVAIASDDTSVAMVSPSNLSFSTTNWNQPQTVTVRGVDDAVSNDPLRTAMISHTASGADYTGAPVASVTVTAQDDDQPGLNFSQNTISFDESAVTGMWTVALNTQPTGAVMISITSGSDEVTVAPASLSFDETNWSTSQTVTVTVVDDRIDNADRMVTITHDASGADYADLSDTVMVTIVNDDTAGFTISHTELTILEGDSGSYMVHLNSEPTDTVTVVARPGTPSGGSRDVVESSQTLEFSTSNWNTPQRITFSVMAESMADVDTDLTVMHTVSNGGYDSVPLEQVTVTIPGLVSDGQGGATFMVQNLRVNVPTGQSLLPDIGGILLTFATGMAPASNVDIVPTKRSEVHDDGPQGYRTDVEGDVGAVDISLSNQSTYTGQVTICLPRKDGGRVYQWQPGDDMNPRGWMVLPQPDGNIPTDYACGISNTFSQFATGSEPSGTVATARLAQLGRIIAGQVVDAVQGRLAASREAGFQATMAGKALPSFSESSKVPTYANAKQHEFGAGSFGMRDWEHTEVHALTEQSLLSGSSFSLTEKSQGAGSMSVWGQASLNRFEGEGLDDGQMTSGFFGTDWTSNQLTAGLALSLSQGKGTWTSNDRGDEFETTVSGIHPYFGYELSDRTSIWGVAGYGQGEVDTINTDMTTSVDIDMLMIAGGVNGDLSAFRIVPENVSLLLKSNALWVNTSSGEDNADVMQMRAAFEASRFWRTTGDGKMKASAEIGFRIDSGDGETGLGVDVGAGMEWNDPSSGINTRLQGRGLLTHADDSVREQGISGSFGWASNPASAEGANLKVSYTVGDSATGGVEALFARDTLSAVEKVGDDLDNHRMEIRFGYGMPVFGNLFVGTPQTALGFSDDKRDVSLGWRMTLVDRSAVSNAGSLGLSVEARRSESASDGYKSEDEIVFRLRTQF